MKHKFTRHLFCLLVLVIFLSPGLHAQPSPKPKCYVVVGVFKFYKNAEYFAKKMEGMGLKSQYKLNSYKNLYYVYSYESEDREAAKQALYKVREEYPGLTKAWLYAGNFKGPHIPLSEWDVQPKPATIVKEGEATIDEEEKPPVQTEEPVAEVAEEEDTGLSWKIYLNTVNTSTLEEVGGKFLVFDAERNQQIREMPTNTLVRIEDPDNRTHRIRIVSDIFGFHEIEYTFDLDEPQKDMPVGIVEMLGDTIVVHCKLQRLRQGDVSTLWQVYFFKDASIMKEESIYELNELLNMMKENKNIKIKIHGHTNGNAFGEVKYLDETDKEFFAINGEHETTNASAKKLSEYRAYTIQQWLVSQGISEDRMEIKGWGGKKMIYDKFDSQADKNVRVEIEIVDE